MSHHRFYYFLVTLFWARSLSVLIYTKGLVPPGGKAGCAPVCEVAAQAWHLVHGPREGDRGYGNWPRGAGAPWCLRAAGWAQEEGLRPRQSRRQAGPPCRLSSTRTCTLPAGASRLLAWGLQAASRASQAITGDRQQPGLPLSLLLEVHDSSAPGFHLP